MRIIISFLELAVLGFRNEKIKEQLGELLEEENAVLAEQLSDLWKRSPVDGVSFSTWGILLNALIDGLALQSLMSPDFPLKNLQGIRSCAADADGNRC